MGTVKDVLEIIDTLSHDERQQVIDYLQKGCSNAPLPISKNVPNDTTLKAIQDTNYETVTLDEFRAMCQ